MIFHGHGIDDATLSLNAGTAHGSYPLDNLKSRVLGKLFKTSDSVSPQIDIDFGSARSCDSIVIGNCNYDDSCAIKYGTADNGSDFENAAASSLAPEPDQSGFYSKYTVFSGGAVSKRYWRLIFDNWSTSYYIGQIFLGVDTSTPYNHDPNFNKGYQYGAQSNLTKGGIDLRYKNHAKKYIENNLRFQGFTDAQAKAFLAYFNNSAVSDGVLKPFFFVPDDETVYCHYAYFVNRQLIFKRRAKDFNEINLSIQQQL